MNELKENKSSNKRLLQLGMLISMAIWGISWTSAKVLSSYGSPLSIAFIRFWMVVITMLPILLISKASFKVDKKGVKYVLLTGLFFGTYSFVFFSGLKIGTAGKGGVLVTTLTPFMSFLIGWVISRRKLKKNEIIGLLCGLIAGAFLLQSWKDLPTIFSLGNSIFLLAAFLWGIMSKFSSYSGPYAHPLTFNFWLHVFVSVTMCLFVNFEEVKNILQSNDPIFWINILHFGIINSTLATACYLYSTTKIGPEKASAFIFLVPVGALISSYIFLGESIEWFTIIGGFMGIIAAMIINKAQN